MKAGADLEQRKHAPPHCGVPTVRDCDPRDHLSESRLAGAVRANDPEEIARADAEGQVVKCVDCLRRRPEARANDRKLSKRFLQGQLLAEDVSLPQSNALDSKMVRQGAIRRSRQTAPPYG